MLPLNLWLQDRQIVWCVHVHITLKKIPNDNMDFKKYTPHITTHNQTFVYDFACI